MEKEKYGFIENGYYLRPTPTHIRKIELTLPNNKLIIREQFKDQIEENNIVDDEMLSKMDYKLYENGEPIKVGDRILFALLEIGRTGNIINNRLIALTEEHFDFFVCEYPHKTRIPALKYR